MYPLSTLTSVSGKLGLPVVGEEEVESPTRSLGSGSGNGSGLSSPTGSSDAEHGDLGMASSSSDDHDDATSNEGGIKVVRCVDVEYSFKS